MAMCVVNPFCITGRLRAGKEERMATRVFSAGLSVRTSHRYLNGFDIFACILSGSFKYCFFPMKNLR
jgi:hypothetical protein